MTNDFEGCTADELYLLHLEVAAVLRKKLLAEKNALEERLEQLHCSVAQARRPYPTVKAKFQNPEQPSETWSGRGKRPRWLDAQLKSGKRIDDFRIDRAAS